MVKLLKKKKERKESTRSSSDNGVCDVEADNVKQAASEEKEETSGKSAHDEEEGESVRFIEFAVVDKLEEKERKTGVLYFSSIPPMFTVTRMREEMSKLGKMGRIFLQPEKRRGKDGKKRKRFTEGWVEFVDKSRAKRIALSINNTPVGGRKRSAACESLWNVKYLSGFKWIHLTEQLSYESRVERHRMRAEISQAKRTAEHFAEQLEKGEHLKRLEQKVLKKGGKWEKYQRQLQQKKTLTSKKVTTNDSEILNLIFTE